MKARHLRSRFLAVALTAIVVAGLATASQARALVQVVTTLYSGALTVHTANGKSWQLSLGVNPNGTDRRASWAKRSCTRSREAKRITRGAPRSRSRP